MKLSNEKFILNIKVIVLLLSIGTISSIAIFSINSRHLFKPKQDSNQKTKVQELSVSFVTALGRIEPQGDIIRLAAPIANQRLAELRVREGQTVRAGQVLAIMDNFKQNQALLENAKAKVSVARSRLAQVEAGEKSGQIQAQEKKVTEIEAELTTNVKIQKAVIARQELELSKAINDYERYKKLSQDGAVSAADTENKRFQVEIEKENLQEAKAKLNQQITTAKERINGAQATLESLKNVKPTDILVAKAELNESISQLRKAQVDLELAYIVAPIAGQILNIHTKVGEMVDNTGILDIGQTQQMYVLAEVYESDIKYVKVGQPATIVSEYGGFTGELKGVVDQIGLQIDKPGIVNDDPAAKADVRVVKVKIRLHPDDSEQVKNLNKLQVRASINIKV
ncbi:secretion protein HlyD [Richelia sinica FACHB-800]|uniref:Secretion protein HlyD n=2 Tax=Richelia TaxID=98443 RepID=A0A975TC07_9NOST|nr:ABC exporter membrane fusion protein [Richelia sinica]QXE26028.1 secretion protein HlyD [Richelia sinica FACHB-800]